MIGELDPRRRGMMTASRAAKALDESPYGGPDDLMREMVRQWFGDEAEFTGNVATEWGERHEAQGIAEYEMMSGQAVTHTGMDQLFRVHPDIDWLSCTLDGTVGEDGLVEHIAPWRARYSHWNQHPAKEIQMRIQLEVCPEREWCDFLIWYPEGLVPPSRVMRDEAWFLKRGADDFSVLARLTRFMNTFQQIIASEERSAPYRAPLVDVRTDEEYLEAAAYHKELRYQRKAVDKQIAAAQAEMVRLAGDATKVRDPWGLLYQRKSSASVKWKAAFEKYAPHDADLIPFTTPAKGGPTWVYRSNDQKEGT